MKEELISFETAKLAKEKGFNEHVKYAYMNLEEGHRLNGKLEIRNLNGVQKWCTNTQDETKVSAPTQSLLQKWLREVHRIHISIIYSVSSRLYNNNLCKAVNNQSEKFDTYEECLEAALLKALKMIK